MPISDPTQPLDLNMGELPPLFALIEQKSKPLLLMTADEIYDNADAELLQQIREDRSIERKPAGIHEQSFSEYVCMWANTTPDGGLIALGVADNGELKGWLKTGVEHENSLSSAPVQRCPDARFTSRRVPFRHDNGDQDYILLVRVKHHPTKVVRTSNGKVFVRYGDEKHELTPAQIRELEIDKGQIPFEQEPSDFEYPKDFNLELIREFTDAFRKGRGLTVAISDIEVLEARRLGKIKTGVFEPNNACAIVFAKDPYKSFPGCRIHFLRFEGEEEGTGERWNAQKDIWVDGISMPHQIKKLEEILDSQLRTFTRLGKDNKFHSAPEYPKFAWYEAVINACVHRSYAALNMPIFVRMFDDRIEIESPGGFPHFVNAQNLVHYPRNPILFDAMQLLGYVRGAREGTRRMREAMLAADLPMPEFAQKDREQQHTVLVRLKNNYKQRRVSLDSDALAVVGEVLFKTLTQDEIRAVNHVAEHGSINVSELQRLTQKSWPAASNTLKTLVKRGIFYTNKKTPINPLGRDTRARYFLAGRGE